VVLGTSLAWGQAPASPFNDSLDFIKKSLQDSNPEKRRLAAVALGGAGLNQKPLQLLYDAMTADKDPGVRQAAVTSLGELKARAAIPKLKTAMENDPQVSFAAARSLWLMGDHSGKDLIMDVASSQQKNPTGKLAQAKLEASRKFHDPNGLAKTGAEEAASALLGPFSIGVKAAEELRKDSGAQSRALAITMLAQQCDTESISAIKAALDDDKNDIVRAAAAKALGTCGNKGSIADLASLVASEKYPVQLAAAASVIRLTTEGPKAAPASLQKK
jgi:HEAT repeat protein